MRTKAIIRLLFTVGVITWLALLFAEISIVFTSTTNLASGVPAWLPDVLLDLFILALFFYYKLKFDKDDV
ncbi:MAG TPA: hypothetical protein VFT90_13110, partial [Chryseosolibacter sp.]|nr:hypothetical protein [Chryseosolibacter sp.]